MSEVVVLEQFPFSSKQTADGSQRKIKQRIYIMPTRHGYLFGAMLIAMLIGAVNYNNSMAFILTFLLASLALVAILHTCRNIAGLMITEAPPSPVFAGEVAKFPLMINNRNGFCRLAVSFVNVPDQWRMEFFSRKNKQKNEIVTTTNIEPTKLNLVEIPVQTKKRGFAKAGRLKIYTTFPLGLFRAWSYINTKNTCVVYPKPAGQHNFPAFNESDEAGVQGKQSGTDDFAGYRNYQAGDPIRDIAWKAYAQEKGLHLKQFSGSGSEKLQLSLEDVLHLHNTEAQLSQLCFWLIEAESQSLPYGLTLSERVIELGQGDQHLKTCLTALAGFGIKET